MFSATVELAKNFDLIGGKLLASDGTKGITQEPAKVKQYKKRQAIEEHLFGTIKRQWGFDYIITKKFKKRASADVGLIFTAYNLRRIFNIIGKDLLKEYLKTVFFLYFQ